MKISIDLDEVVVDHVTYLVDYYNRTHKDSVPLDAVSTWQIVNHLPKLNGCDTTLYKMWDDFMATEDFANIPEIPGALAGIKELSKKHSLYFVTARNPVLANKTYDWLIKNDVIQYPTYFYKDKGYLIDKLGVDVHIDDGVHNLDSVVKSSSAVPLLFTAPWNRDEQRYIRCDTWKDVLDEVAILEASRLENLIHKF